MKNDSHVCIHDKYQYELKIAGLFNVKNYYDLSPCYIPIWLCQQVLVWSARELVGCFQTSKV